MIKDTLQHKNVDNFLRRKTFDTSNNNDNLKLLFGQEILFRNQIAN